MLVLIVAVGRVVDQIAFVQIWLYIKCHHCLVGFLPRRGRPGYNQGRIELPQWLLLMLDRSCWARSWPGCIRLWNNLCLVSTTVARCTLVVIFALSRPSEPIPSCILSWLNSPWPIWLVYIHAVWEEFGLAPSLIINYLILKKIHQSLSCIVMVKFVVANRKRQIFLYSMLQFYKKSVPWHAK